MGSSNKSWTLRLERDGLKSGRPITAGGRTLRAGAKWPDVKHKNRAAAITAIKSRDAARRRAYNNSRK